MKKILLTFIATILVALLMSSSQKKSENPDNLMSTYGEIVEVEYIDGDLCKALIAFAPFYEDGEYQYMWIATNCYSPQLEEGTMVKIEYYLTIVEMQKWIDICVDEHLNER